MNNFEAIIGIEIHVELKTKTKMFSPAKIDFDAEPNTTAHQIDLGYPGTLPLPNKNAVKYAVALAKALKMQIDTELHFDRKHYFYPDLPKGFQITQYRRPIGKNGELEIILKTGTKSIVKIERIQLEEDTARQHHEEEKTKLDYNRSGVPLIEIVTYPVITSAEEAAEYVEMIRKTVLFLGISNAKLEQGSLRADINISLRPKGSLLLGTKVEIKNINSINNIRKAVEYEIREQKLCLLTGKKITQATKRFDDNNNQTKLMREKTDGVEYRYFEEPNIPIIKLSEEFINSVKLPELPLQRRKRYLDLRLQEIYVNSLVNDLKLSEFFDSIEYHDKEKLSKIFFSEVVSLANLRSVPAYELGIKASDIAKSLELLEEEIISGKSIKKLIPLLVDFKGDINKLLEKNNLKQIVDARKIRNIILNIINKNEKLVSEYPNRPERVLKFILGTVMKESLGQVSPTISDTISKEILDEKFR